MAVTKGSGTNFIDLTGNTYGRWRVIKRTDDIKKVRFICECSCGKIRSISSTDLRSGRTNSCGCIVKDRAGKTIPQTNKREYRSWTGMKQRCYYTKHIEYHRYGGRGIIMCDEWKHDFNKFLSDMGKCPPNYSIDRIDNNGNYTKENCKWVSKQEQSSNMSHNVHVEYMGNKSTLKELAKSLNLNYSRLHSQYRRKGLSLDEAIVAVSTTGINRTYYYKSQSS